MVQAIIVSNLSGVYSQEKLSFLLLHEDTLYFLFKQGTLTFDLFAFKNRDDVISFETQRLSKLLLLFFLFRVNRILKLSGTFYIQMASCELHVTQNAFHATYCLAEKNLAWHK